MSDTIDGEAHKLMANALHEALQRLRSASLPNIRDVAGTRATLSKSLVEAVNNGERDLESRAARHQSIDPGQRQQRS